MRFILLAPMALLLLPQCCWFTHCQNGNDQKYSRTEQLIADFSKSVTAYYEKRQEPIPQNFDENRFFAVLQEVPANQTEVQSIRRSYQVKARAREEFYSVILCDPTSGKKLMEDLSCTFQRVDLRYWNQSAFSPCDFAIDWKTFCK